MRSEAAVGEGQHRRSWSIRQAGGGLRTVLRILVATVVALALLMPPAQADARSSRKPYAGVEISLAAGIFSISQLEGANPINDAGLAAGTFQARGGTNGVAAVLDTNSRQLTVFDKSGEFSRAVDVNNRGEVSGVTRDSGRNLAFWWRLGDGAVRYFVPPDPALSAVGPLNDRGDVIVNADVPPDLAATPVLWNGRTGAVRELTGISHAIAIDNRHRVLSDSGVLLTPDGTVHTLPLPAEYASGGAFAMSDRGQVVGYAVRPAAAGIDLVRWNSLTAAPCVVTSEQASIARAINRRGEIVGLQSVGDVNGYVTSAAYWKGCRSRTVVLAHSYSQPTVETNLAGAFGINRSGRVIGWSFREPIGSDGNPTYALELWTRRAKPRT